MECFTLFLVSFRLIIPGDMLSGNDAFVVVGVAIFIVHIPSEFHFPQPRLDHCPYMPMVFSLQLFCQNQNPFLDLTPL